MRNSKAPTESDMMTHVLGVIAKWLAIGVAKPWLIIYGDVGNGKSTTIGAIKRLYSTLGDIAKERLQNFSWKLSAEDRAKCQYIKGLPLPVLVTAQHIANVAVANPTEFENLKRVQILLIDDVGIEPIKVLHYGTEINPMRELLFYRYDRKAMTIMTTNNNSEELAEIYEERIADRLCELASRVAYQGGSFRGQK